MAVLLPDGTYEVRRNAPRTDSYRQQVSAYPAAADWSGSGARRLNPDRSFDIYLDPAAWPLGYDDEITCPDGVQLLVRTWTKHPAGDDPDFAEVAHVLAHCEPRSKPRTPTEAP